MSLSKVLLKAKTHATSSAYLELLSELLVKDDLEDDLEISHSSDDFYENLDEFKVLLESISSIYGVKPFIAGGCPRDIYRGSYFSDVDIFIPIGKLDVEHPSDKEVRDIINSYREQIGILKEKYPQLDKVYYNEIPSHYQIPYLLDVLTTFINGIKVQLIFTTVDSVQDVLDTFAVNISKVIFDENFSIKITEEAALDFENKRITFISKNPLSDRYMSKILNKFPGYSVVEK